MSLSTRGKGRSFLSVREICIFAMLATLMFVSKKAMEALPNIHLVGMLTIVYTLCYRVKALIPIYLYVFLDGLFLGFSPWWFPYLYVWTLLWGAVMLLPRRTPRIARAVILPLLCALHGLFFGVLYAPVQALLFHLTFEEMLVWIAAGASFDIIHAIGNFCVGLLILPMSELLLRLSKI